MLESRPRQLDKQDYANILESALVAMRMGEADSAEELILAAEALKKRIDTYDYRYEEIIWAKTDALTKAFEEINTGKA